ncbi:MAG: hypothetical protein K5872_03950 [Rhizobiaceae bacterium]|nr:hypothetical protein [Rhizobiaceae bacterium]MCV0405364.1 hypothetical protein [Rhizobiaceae bacterium]
MRTALLAALAWHLLLVSGYGVGQLVHGARAIVADTPQAGDLIRLFVHSGVDGLTVWSTRLGGAVGVAGCIGLLLGRRWGLICVLLAAIPLAWSVLVWGLLFVFWRAFDTAGSWPLLAHIAATLLTAVGLPILVLTTSRPNRSV